MRQLKVLFLVSLFSAPAFGAVTQAQVDQAKAANQQMLACYVQMNAYVNSVNYILHNSVLSVPGSTFTVTIPQATIDQAIDLQLYQNNKSCFVAAFGTFP